MQNRFNNNDFEQFVKQNADQYRMFPSDKVWGNIHNTLHNRRRWYGIGLTLLILSAGVVTWVMLNTAGKNRQVVSTLPVIKAQPLVQATKKITPPLIMPDKSVNNKNSYITSIDKLQKIAFTDLSTEGETISANIERTVVIAYNSPAMPVTKTDILYQPQSVAKNLPVLPPTRQANNKSVSVPAYPVKVNDYSFALSTNNNKQAVSNNSEVKAFNQNDIYPFTIESVINSYTHIGKRKKTSLEFYLTPTISYRGLKENKPFISASRSSSSGTGPNYYASDINSIVTHKPDLGLQLGFTIGYPLSKKVKLISGLQFNVSKYDIRAYSYPSEIATIALSNAAGGTNTVSTVTNYRNAGGSKADWLHNLYFSVAAPIGLELKVLGNRKAYMGISGTVQPTYITSNRSYLLSTDYKNYAEVPSLIRKWNINTGFEIFAGYTTGKLKWRIGPQVRYQTMSSFQKQYPVKEHLFDFGLKMGIMLR